MKKYMIAVIILILVGMPITACSGELKTNGWGGKKPSNTATWPPATQVYKSEKECEAWTNCGPYVTPIRCNVRGTEDNPCEVYLWPGLRLECTGFDSDGKKIEYTADCRAGCSLEQGN